jgi:membrane protein implicated in regulation of membrane protease activity
MNKKTNTILFILGATLVNIVITLGAFLLLFVLLAAVVIPRFSLSPDVLAGGIPLIFILSIFLSFVVYRAILKLITKRVEMEKYFDPIFMSKHKQKKPNKF